nr:MAG TPA: hypothetical protein [Caudoviricetes sp.]
MRDRYYCDDWGVYHRRMYRIMHRAFGSADESGGK